MRFKAHSLLVVAMFISLVPVPSGAGDNWKDALKESLRSKYELARFGSDRLRITQPGTVLVIQQDGLTADPAKDISYTTNKIVDGRIAQAGGFGSMLQNKKRSRILKLGERVYVTKIDVKDNEVHFFLMSCDTFDFSERGYTMQTRYISFLNFQFPKDYLQSADGDAVKKVVDQVIIPETEMKAASTKSVELGQTPEQVEAALGKPDKIVNLGAKKVYVYKDMKIVFVDGKVADVQ